ncbi:MAG: hypothetical protein ABL860_08570 [Candidatus Nitrotoga sp.]
MARFSLLTKTAFFLGLAIAVIAGVWFDQIPVITQFSLPTKIAFFLGLAIAVIAGIWFDQVPVLNQPHLFATFQVMSLTGIAWGILVSLDWFAPSQDLASPFRTAILLLTALVVWRISYFPIMVFAGWIATLGERLTFAVSGIISLPIIIYPIFFITMLFMFAGAALALGAIVYLQHKEWMIITLPAFVMAAMVSFSKPSDIGWLPDTHINVREPLPVAMLPIENPYLPLMSSPEYPLQKKALLFAAGSIYVFVPHSPWAGTVKGTLEDLFRKDPNGSTSIRILDHYESYHVAHKFIRS